MFFISKREKDKCEQDRQLRIEGEIEIKTQKRIHLTNYL